MPNIYVHMGQMDTNSLKHGGDGFVSVGPFIFRTSFRHHDLEQEGAHKYLLFLPSLWTALDARDCPI